MKGIELSRQYFEQYGMPMLKADFKELLPFIAVGFTGSGSEHYGFDDAVSTDHDFEPGFTVFLPNESVIDRRNAFLLERAYTKLPKEFLGIKREPLSPVGGNRHGIVRISDYYEKAVGSKSGILSVEQWLKIPDYALAEAINGIIFYDGFGEVTKIREYLANMPDDILKKRIAGNLFIMAQSGQYNYERCLAHNEPGAAQLACCEFVNAAIKLLFLLNGKYAPYYKWSFHALKELKLKHSVADGLESLICTDSREIPYAKAKIDIIEKLAQYVTDTLKEKNLSSIESNDLIKHAYRINDTVQDGYIRNLHILYGV